MNWRDWIGLLIVAALLCIPCGASKAKKKRTRKRKLNPISLDNGND